MARVIEFHVPQNFKPTARWLPIEQRGRVIEFPSAPARKSACAAAEPRTVCAPRKKWQMLHVEDIHCRKKKAARQDLRTIWQKISEILWTGFTKRILEFPAAQKRTA